MSLDAFIVTPVAGAVIGAFTNWLAIRMLFRPHYAKYVFGIKIPFTPGLMPKERHRLAKKIGETVAQHILTENMLKSKMLSDDNIVGISTGLLSLMEQMKPELNKLLASNIERILKEKDISEYVDQFLCYLQPIAKKNGRSYFAGGEFKNGVAAKLDELYSDLYDENRKLSSYLPPNTLEVVQSMVEVNLPMVESFVRKALYETPQIEAAVRKLLSKTIESSVGSLVSIFINKDKAFDSICAGVVEFLGNDTNRELIVAEVMGLAQKLMDCDMQFFLQKVPEGVKLQLTEKMNEIVSEQLVGDVIEKVFEYVLEELRKMGPIRIHDLITRAVSEQELTDIISNATEKLVDGLAAFVSEKLISTENVRKWLAAGINHLFAGVDVGKMAEEQINALDIAEAEEIVVSVVKKELTAITVVGGVLGFIIGLLPGIMSL